MIVKRFFMDDLTQAYAHRYIMN